MEGGRIPYAHPNINNTQKSRGVLAKGLQNSSVKHGRLNPYETELSERNKNSGKDTGGIDSQPLEKIYRIVSLI